MGLSYRHLGRFDEARKYFQEGLKLDPTYPAVSSIWVTSRSGKEITRQLKAFFRNALKSNPDYSEALLELANLRSRARSTKMPRTFLRRYVKVSRDPASGYYKACDGRTQPAQSGCSSARI